MLLETVCFILSGLAVLLFLVSPIVLEWWNRRKVA